MDGSRRTLWVFVLTAMAGASLHADVGTGTKSISLLAGGAWPTSVNHFSDSHKAGLLGGVEYLYHLDYFTSVGVQLQDSQFGRKVHPVRSAAGGQLNAQSDVNIITAELVGRYSMRPMARFVPYIRVGLGANSLHQTSEGTPAKGSTWADTNTTESRQLADVDSIGLSASAGGGLETALSKHVLLGVEALWRILGVSRDAYGNNTLNVPSLFLRLGWRFGQEAAPPGA